MSEPESPSAVTKCPPLGDIATKLVSRCGSKTITPRPPIKSQIVQLIKLCRCIVFPCCGPCADVLPPEEREKLINSTVLEIPDAASMERTLERTRDILQAEVAAAVRVMLWESKYQVGEDVDNACANQGDLHPEKDCISMLWLKEKDHQRAVSDSLAQEGSATFDAVMPSEEELNERVRCRIVYPFLQRLPEMAEVLAKDVDATVKQDVVVNHKSEIILNYPGIHCLLHQRVAHLLHRLGAPLLLTRMITEIAHSATGIDIHPACTIGHSCFIDHGTGIVVGATAEIGNHVSLYQGVCLGAKSFKKAASGERIKHLPRHPIVEDGVTLYAHCSVLGRVRIGKGAVIGGNIWVTKDVPPHDVLVQGKHERAPSGYVDGAGI